MYRNMYINLDDKILFSVSIVHCFFISLKLKIILR